MTSPPTEIPRAHRGTWRNSFQGYNDRDVANENCVLKPVIQSSFISDLHFVRLAGWVSVRESERAGVRTGGQKECRRTPRDKIPPPDCRRVLRKAAVAATTEGDRVKTLIVGGQLRHLTVHCTAVGHPVAQIAPSKQRPLLPLGCQLAPPHPAAEAALRPLRQSLPPTRAAIGTSEPLWRHGRRRAVIL